MFADLVKAFKAAKHELFMEILYTYGVPPTYVSTISGMYENTVVRLIIRKVYVTIDCTTGVKQGDSIVPILSLLLVMKFAETLEGEWDNA